MSTVSELGRLPDGTVVNDDYRVERLLATGRMAAVYCARQLSLDRQVALKLLGGELSDDHSFRERFRREGVLQAVIDHPHIVPVYGAGESDHGLFIAMRLIHGSTLKDLIVAGELDPRRGLALIDQVASALDAAHEVGLIHRDVKPQNVLIGANDHAYLADFGLTKTIGAGTLTESGQFIGTIDYVPPEQAWGEGATPQSDVYSLAAVLYEALTGAVPFSRPTDPAVLYAHMTEPVPKPSELRPELPPALDEVVCRGMAKDPEARPSSAAELVEAAALALG